MKANPGAHTPQVILDGMGIEAGAKARRPYYSAMKDNTEGGYLKRSGTGRRTAYEFLSDPPPRQVGTSEQRIEKHRAYMRQRHIKNGGRTLAELRADEALRKAARAEWLLREQAERRALRQVCRDAKELARPPRKPQPKRLPNGHTVIAVRASVARRAAAVAARAPAQSVDDWIRAGGQVIRVPGIEQYIPDRCRA
ncbi:hypothetical protein [Xanthomonas phaseoli]|uniref:hypothetical protein n=2 Tax=Xanthomonas phaseoli TaxID=1985254 RepID=UPI0012374FD1|nr:hypothetical protein [Xanthomonas phaseoli]